MSHDFVPFAFTMLFSLLALAAVFLGAYLLLARKRHREEQRLSLHMKLLDRVGSAKEFGEFLATDEGKQFLGVISPVATNPHLRLLRTVQMGIPAITVGAGLLIGEIADVFPGDVNVTIVAVLSVAGGIGMLIASAVSYRLARKLGIVEDRAPRGSDVTSPR